jgi:hypothetical protein
VPGKRRDREHLARIGGLEARDPRVCWGCSAWDRGHLARIGGLEARDPRVAPSRVGRVSLWLVSLSNHRTTETTTRRHGPSTSSGTALRLVSLLNHRTTETTTQRRGPSTSAGVSKAGESCRDQGSPFCRYAANLPPLCERLRKRSVCRLGSYRRAIGSYQRRGATP